MARVVVETPLEAPVDRCFDLARFLVRRNEAIRTAATS
jgi:hypothetical protein